MAVALTLLQLPKLDTTLTNDCHRPTVPCVLVRAKLLNSLLQLIEKAIDICCVCICPDFLTSDTPNASIWKESTEHGVCQTPHPDLADSFSMVATRPDGEFCLSIHDYMGCEARTISHGAINTHLSAFHTRRCTTNKLLDRHDKVCKNEDRGDTSHIAGLQK